MNNSDKFVTAGSGSGKKSRIRIRQVKKSRIGSETLSVGRSYSFSYHLGHVEVLLDPLAALVELVLHAHDVEGVQGVHDGGPHGRGPENGGGVTTPGHYRQLKVIM